MTGNDELAAKGRLPWPLITIDFEASSLDQASYPIEVGLCRWRGQEAPLEVWSTLIRPTAGWIDHGAWSRAAEIVHGISHDELDLGMDPVDVIAFLNQAAGVSPTFNLADWDELTGTLPFGGYLRMSRYLNGNAAPHRAKGDADRLMRSFAFGLGVMLPEAIDLVL